MMRSAIEVVRHYLLVAWGFGDGDEADIAARAIVNAEKARKRAEITSPRAKPSEPALIQKRKRKPPKSKRKAKR